RPARKMRVRPDLSPPPLLPRRPPLRSGARGPPLPLRGRGRFSPFSLGQGEEGSARRSGAAAQACAEDEGAVQAVVAPRSSRADLPSAPVRGALLSPWRGRGRTPLLPGTGRSTRSARTRPEGAEACAEDEGAAG